LPVFIPGNNQITIGKVFEALVWKCENPALIFAAALYRYLSRKAEGNGPMKP
jgi:hypothetical protein